ncbi:MAG: aminotransferase class I/II-fold pyridoxal phosphate-dependent enzyme [Sphingobacteriales bacterium]|nr:MAG: aminotransferase class I/II-fold pyridoxal phosphate-dependent enzyme [Sphingobacteriales bacterium]
MYSFKNDYSEGAHPNILQRLLQTNTVQQAGYGEDEYSLEAKARIRQRIGHPEAVVHFISGGTQTNLIAIAALLRPHEAVISAQTGHIATNEAGAIEATGHKVITVAASDGKLVPEAIEEALRSRALAPHVVKPRLVYISNATELGTVYTRRELEALAAVCKANDLLLYLDGARLGHALTADANDLTFEEVARLTDVFYIGATKNGGLLGEALVFTAPELAVDFGYVLKQKGALLAKGRILGIQFEELFRNDLYFTLARQANDAARQLAEALIRKGISFWIPPTTNQLFPILSRHQIETLSERYQFYVWKEIDATQAAIRLITSWATPEAVINAFIADLETL